MSTSGGGDWGDAGGVSLGYKFPTLIKKGEVSTNLGYSIYKETAIEIENALVGLKTSTGLEIKGYSAHFVARVIGRSATNNKFNRAGVAMSEAKEAIEKGERAGTGRGTGK